MELTGLAAQHANNAVTMFIHRNDIAANPNYTNCVALNYFIPRSGNEYLDFAYYYCKVINGRPRHLERAFINNDHRLFAYVMYLYRLQFDHYLVR